MCRCSGHGYSRTTNNTSHMIGKMIGQSLGYMAIQTGGALLNGLIGKILNGTEAQEDPSYEKISIFDL